MTGLCHEASRRRHPCHAVAGGPRLKPGLAHREVHHVMGGPVDLDTLQLQQPWRHKPDVQHERQRRRERVCEHQEHQDARRIDRAYVLQGLCREVQDQARP